MGSVYGRRLRGVRHNSDWFLRRLSEWQCICIWTTTRTLSDVWVWRGELTKPHSISTSFLSRSRAHKHFWRRAAASSMYTFRMKGCVRISFLRCTFCVLAVSCACTTHYCVLPFPAFPLSFLEFCLFPLTCHNSDQHSMLSHAMSVEHVSVIVVT